MLRLMTFGWLFALVVAGAWIGVFTPAAGTEATDEDTWVVDRSIGETLARFGRRRGALDPTLAGDPSSCPHHLSTGPSFAPNQVELDAAGEAVLTAATASLIETSCVTDPIGRSCGGAQAEISVEGHSDDLPSSRRGGNQQLSYDRARSVADWLTAAGFTIRSIDGLGASEPTPAPNPDTRSLAERRADDRRVTLRAWCPRP